jgi:RNA-binding protein
VVVQPGAIDLLAFRLDLHAAPIFAASSRALLARDNRVMSQIELTIAERKNHRAQAHHLSPVVMIGNDGLTPGVRKEVDAALNAHGLIKIRVLGDDRAQREAMYQSLADELSAAPIQHIGKLLVLWRPKPAKPKAQDEDRKPGPRDFKVLKYSARGGQRPEVKTLRVLGNQRLTPGGQVRRAKKPKQKSIKKGRQT